MLNRIAKRYNLIFTKDNKYNILFQLLVNQLFILKLKTIKLFRGINKPIIHYYCLAWNESNILPFIYQYYEPFVEKFFVYDNESNDTTKEILNKLIKAEFFIFKTDSKFNDEIHVQLKNTIWKKSRGKADYVIVCDTDEILYHIDLSEFLKKSKKLNFTYFIPVGYNMYSESFPKFNCEDNHLITNQIKTGLINSMYSKPILFDPHRIVEINYLPGAHQAFPVGIIKKFCSPELKLLHYKNIGLIYVLDRIKQYKDRLSETNKEKGFGIEYLNDDKRIIDDFYSNLKKSKKVI